MKIKSYVSRLISVSRHAFNVSCLLSLGVASLAALSASAAVDVVSPRDGETYMLLSPAQKEVMSLPTYAERLKLLRDDAKGEKRLAHDETWRTSRPLVFRWQVTDRERGPWAIRLGQRVDLSDARIIPIGRDVKPDKDGLVTYTFERANLEIGRRYFWTVTAHAACDKWGHVGKACTCRTRKESVTSGLADFVTDAQAPRWIAVEGRVGNIRDLGGRMTRYGRRVRQGLVYRGQGLNDNSIIGERGFDRLTLADVEYLTKTLGIRTDLDLRSAGEVTEMTGSPLGPGVAFVWRSSAADHGIFCRDPKNIMTADAMKTMAENFRLFCDRANYPIYFHCIGGADRTGALAYVLNGVLGVDRHELETDWEATFYPVLPELEPRYNGSTYWRREQYFDEGFAKYGQPNDSWNARIELYLKACGITDAEIAAFRDIMLEP